jgi:Amt family ammonium transporter
MFDSTPLPAWPLLAVALGLLAPIGVGLLASDDETPRRAGLFSLLAILITLVGYAATGFALHFGGIGILIDHPDVAALVWEWTPLKSGDLTQWGVAGWMGFGMAQAQTPLAALLFLSALPLSATAALLGMLTLWRRVSAGAAITLAALIALFLAPLVGNWTLGGGWLMHLGQSIGAGDGYLDFGGASFFLLAGGAALAELLAFRGHQTPDDSDAIPVSALTPALGAGLLAAGSIGWIIASPLHLWAGSSPVQGVLNGLLAMAAGGLIGLAYRWFVAGEADAGWTARSAVAGWVAALAVLPWMTPLQAMLTGAVAAWIFILAVWFIRELLGWYDAGDIFSAFGLPAIWGLLTAGFFAPAPGQFKAQFIGILSIFLAAFFTVSVMLLIILLFRRVRPARTAVDPLPDPEPEPVLSEN